MSPPLPPLTRAADVAVAAQLACLLEASAPKPGNVAPGVHFHDTRYEDFLASGAAIGPAMARAGRRPLGATILSAVQASVRWTRSNTNLGIVLLLAPLARAALVADRGQLSLRGRVGRVVAESTLADATHVYAAIRLASPGGLGTAAAQDVAHEPTVTLRDAMTLAADRDGIAREYTTSFARTFEVGAPALERSRRDELDWADAVVEAYLTLLADAPDTHIARKLGWNAAASISRDARAVLRAGGVRSDAGQRAIADFDRALRDGPNTRNPGTTADLTAAAIFVVLLSGGWR